MNQNDLLSIDPNLLPVPLLSMEPVLKMYPNTSIAELANIIGVDRERLSIWQKSHLNLITAENLATKIGLHPSYIWGPEYHIAVYMMEIIASIRYEQKKYKRNIKRRSIHAQKTIIQNAS